ncbi:MULTISPECIES: lipoyl(octanoyl) transferase LipB [Mumia]|uniref:lipoyl(octanoyl) transferase LipB n=1 Tax=Mumia TaxID=1546255 RepID=UPI00141E817F|nr:lipoyl(octanoyl) transferase LipB [Mumia sp. ZJ1417]QMW67693.1 lipoyl(octanoyl) transferase LipB [Mumia sp. ZJ1417]
MSALEVRRIGLGSEETDYEEMWALQRALHADRVADTGGDIALFLEHAPVFTAGKRTEDWERPRDGSLVVDIDRGGNITFHGPGQLVGYPIVKLPPHVLVVDYVRRVEEAMIRTVADLGVTCGRVEGRSGVWVAADERGPERKLGQIGIRVAGGVTMHGLALNACVDMRWFDKIVPCGIADAGVTSLSLELARTVTTTEVADALEPHLRELLSWQPYTPSPDLAHVAISGAVSYGLASHLA